MNVGFEEIQIRKQHDLGSPFEFFKRKPEKARSQQQLSYLLSLISYVILSTFSVLVFQL